MCNSCPCLGSKYAIESEIKTVNPKTREPEDVLPVLNRIRELRSLRKDGERIDKEEL